MDAGSRGEIVTIHSTHLFVFTLNNSLHILETQMSWPNIEQETILWIDNLRCQESRGLVSK